MSMSELLTADAELEAEREDFDRFIADVLRAAALEDPSYLETYARFTKQLIVDAPKTTQ